MRGGKTLDRYLGSTPLSEDISGDSLGDHALAHLLSISQGNQKGPDSIIFILHHKPGDYNSNNRKTTSGC